ncbi:MAG: metallophosphoesterase [Candidatus Daviesbacteria bacterium]|nr:metallophosphoesterase [Candidatus Daviesbacteria bacterium]
MFKRHYKRRSSNVVFIFFRLVLSLVMFTVLLLGAYTAYKHFSGLDPLKLDPQAVFNTALSKLNLSQKVLVNQSSVSAETSKPLNSNLAFRFLIVADSHNDNADLGKAIKQGRHKYPDLKFIIGLGDYTEVGTIAELENAKKEFDNSALRYFLIPGDHDLWDCRNRSLLPSSCFSQVFGPSYQSFELENFEFLLLDNSDNYTGFDAKQAAWIAMELEKPKKIGAKGLFVFMHEPLYHPSSDHVMGWVEKSLKLQAGGLIFQLKEVGATKIFAGDIHYFSEYSEPKTNLSLVTIGAVTIERNAQAPRFAVVSVFNDGSTIVEDVGIK